MLIAQSDIIYRSRHYHPGEILPGDSSFASAWIESGAAVDMELSELLKPTIRAKMETAETGLPGFAVNGETEENLVGKIPKTEARKRE